MENEIKIFIRFLKENKCYDIYIHNLNKEFNKPISLNKMFYKYDPKDMITNSFCWLTSKQGYQFWLDVEKKWETFYDTMLLSKT